LSLSFHGRNGLEALRRPSCRIESNIGNPPRCVQAPLAIFTCKVVATHAAWVGLFSYRTALNVDYSRNLSPTAVHVNLGFNLSQLS